MTTTNSNNDRKEGDATMTDASGRPMFDSAGNPRMNIPGEASNPPAGETSTTPTIPTPRKQKDLKQYILDRCVPEPNSGCWLWIPYSQPKGYGICSVNGKMMLAHRVSYEAFKEPLKDGHFICHKCDTPACVNPEHLFQGTPADNLNDAYQKERKGKLTHAQRVEARAMRASGISYSNVAKVFGVDRTAIMWMIKHEIY